MSREILEAMHALAVEKGIATDKLHDALEDALQSAYKKQPGAAKYARVELDDESGDFRVFELIVPEELEDQLLIEAEEEARTVDPETGEMIEPTDPEIDPAKFEEYRDQIDERYEHNQRIKAVIKEVSNSTKGPSIIVSRRDPELIKQLFELEVPEIADGLVEIANVAREPGYRSKIAVVSHADGVDPVGACVGPRGSRVREVLVDDDAKQATVVVPDDQLSLAIGREGQNARLAARLTGWRIDIRSETEFATDTEEGGGYADEEDLGGRCAAVNRNGRRCPNAALPGSRYCGLDSHQALANKDTDVVGSA